MIHRWLRDLFKIGLRRQIVDEDIYECYDEHSSDKVTSPVEKLWEDEQSQTKRKPSLIRVALKAFWFRVIVVGFFYATFETCCK